MAVTIAYSREIDCVVVTYEGEATPEEIQTTIRDALAMAVERQCRRFLVDATELEHRGGTLLDTYELPQDFEHFPDIRKYKDAIILPRRQAEAQDLEFFETISHNRGYNVRVFTDRQSAVDWLME